MQEMIVVSLLSFFVALGSFGAGIIGNHNTNIVSPLPRESSTPTPSPIPTNTPTPIPTETPTPTPTPTSVPSPTPAPITVTSQQLEELFSRFSDEYHIDKELLKRIANCESGFNVNASGSNGQYVGMFQFSEGAWRSARDRMGQSNDISLRTSPEESIRTAAFTISQNNLHIWPSCSK